MRAESSFGGAHSTFTAVSQQELRKVPKVTDRVSEKKTGLSARLQLRLSFFGGQYYDDIVRYCQSRVLYHINLYYTDQYFTISTCPCRTSPRSLVKTMTAIASHTGSRIPLFAINNATPAPASKRGCSPESSSATMTHQTIEPTNSLSDHGSSTHSHDNLRCNDEENNSTDDEKMEIRAVKTQPNDVKPRSGSSGPCAKAESLVGPVELWLSIPPLLRKTSASQLVDSEGTGCC